MTSSTLLITIACLFVFSTVINGQTTLKPPASVPNELNLNQKPPDTTIITDNTPQLQPQQPQQPSQQPPKGNQLLDIVPARPTQQTELEEMTYPNNPFHFSPFPFFPFGNPFHQPIMPSIPTNPFSFFGRHLQESMRNSQEEFNKMEQQAGGESTEVKYLNRNGITYARTCVTKQV